MALIRAGHHADGPGYAVTTGVAGTHISTGQRPTLLSQQPGGVSTGQPSKPASVNATSVRLSAAITADHQYYRAGALVTKCSQMGIPSVHPAVTSRSREIKSSVEALTAGLGYGSFITSSGD